MDNRAGEMEVFVLAAELKSFSAAGRKLKLSPSAVSKLVTRLENRLGTRLVVRSTRLLQLTPEGETYLARAQRILAEIADTEEVVSGGGRMLPRGPLSINASVGFGERYILPLAGEFQRLFPDVQLDITLTDDIVDLIRERVDIAIRHGQLRDSSLMARKLGESRQVVMASPEYLERHGLPKTPDELIHHNCINFNFRRAVEGWPFRDPQTGRRDILPVSGNLKASSGSIIRQFCLDGLGIGRVGRFHVEPDIAAGRLVPVLEDFNPEDIEQIHAVYAGHEHLAVRIRAYIDFLAARL
ncbi:MULTISPECIES: LysR family transcriptional regulator [Rhizobium/Agrobacterium group]|uniref:LysR family transcriptional regulator n=2 Tax=Neorhizobium TaxID=1525371 RepID=A0ABV0M711_9HYPH|nr:MULTISPECIES: LysR family transcriptional regulator [Rhizobium/Agrobacterium group]KGD85899.1 LysR family transcriptional regulator [Rhizobium sp. YS-1r]MBP1842548.1 DNA-binding transcriptional LysR family regulator [Neorhizobium petrolearium]MCC2608938.1 LysR family transcriptional regulator [Neorhizobium petrolearium]WGI69183.1 LysR family transcriptional regulator [Neorhizobium petrolearium]